MSELADVQAELKTVKQAMQSGSSYLGMKDDNLAKYFLQLNEKENLLLSKSLSGASPTASGPLIQGSTPAAGGYVGNVEGAAARLAAALPPKPAAPQPAGPPPNFDRNVLRDVVQHMCTWEADPAESSKALKALASLAYSHTRDVIDDVTALNQVLRLMQLHSGSSVVQLNAVHTLQNMAHDEAAALGSLSELPVLTALVSSLGSGGKSSNLDARATEAVARIVAAAENDATGQLAKVFRAVIGCGTYETCAPNMTLICDQLVKNEVTNPKKIAEACMAASAQARDAPEKAAGWLELIKCLCGDKMSINEQQTTLVDAGAIQMSVSLMEHFVRHAVVQLTGIETLSSLVGIYLEALEVFAKAGGLRQIETLLREHVDNLPIQMKGIRAMSSGSAWSEDMRQKSSYSWQNAVQITKNAMMRHARDADLQIACLELLLKCMDHLPIADQVKTEVGGDLILTSMRTHEDNQKVQKAGGQILKQHFKIEQNGRTPNP